MRGPHARHGVNGLKIIDKADGLVCQSTFAGEPCHQVASLGNHLCIMGNVPSSLLQVGSPQEVDEYCRNLIKTCGKGGGFILSHGSSIDEAKPENLKAPVDAAKKYGVS